MNDVCVWDSDDGNDFIYRCTPQTMPVRGLRGMFEDTAMDTTPIQSGIRTPAATGVARRPPPVPYAQVRFFSITAIITITIINTITKVCQAPPRPTRESRTMRRSERLSFSGSESMEQVWAQHDHHDEIITA